MGIEHYREEIIVLSVPSQLVISYAQFEPPISTISIKYLSIALLFDVGASQEIIKFPLVEDRVVVGVATYPGTPLA